MIIAYWKNKMISNWMVASCFLYKLIIIATTEHYNLTEGWLPWTSPHTVVYPPDKSDQLNSLETQKEFFLEYIPNAPGTTLN